MIYTFTKEGRMEDEQRLASLWNLSSNPRSQQSNEIQ